MRLIDADKFKEFLSDLEIKKPKQHDREYFNLYINKILPKFIDEQSTAYDVEKFLEELEDMSDELNHTIGCMCPENTFDLIDKAIKTIQELSAKLSYSNLYGGWHDVEKELPEEGKWVPIWYEYFRYGDYNCMYQTLGVGFHFEGRWHVEGGGTKIKVFAWLDVKPYKKEV